MASTVNRLIGLIKASGRLADPAGQGPVIASIIDLSSSLGLGKDFTRRVVSSALRTADPGIALNRTARLLSAVDDPNFYSLLEDTAGIRSLMAILGFSNFLSSLIIRSPGDYIWLMRKEGLSGDRKIADMHRDISLALDRITTMEDVQRVLRANKYREMLRIGVRDLLGTASLEQTVADISNLAEVSIDAAVEKAFEDLKEKHGIPVQTASDGVQRPGRFCVLGLGKLGGEELNYSSDVDLYYLYSHHEGMTTGRRSHGGGYRDAIENHRFFVKMGEVVTRLLNDRTSDGMVFRVDLRLRPEGESGEIAYSLPSLEIYYESWGRTMDRLALLKAKPVGGDRRLGEDFLALIAPFIYRSLLDYDTLEEIGSLKERIDLHVREETRGIRDIKLGRGGIREIEFLIQGLQLIHGGRNPVLREKNTLRALERLMQNGFLSERDAEELRGAYVFLRNVEHRIQLVEERQTQVLPGKKEELEKLAWTLGYISEGIPDLPAFERDLDSNRDKVMELFDRLFGKPDKIPVSAIPGQDDLLREDLPRDQAVEKLRETGFSDPEKAYETLLFLRDGPSWGHFPDSCRILLKKIAPGMMSHLKNVPDPDSALSNLERFIGRVGARVSYYSMLAENPEAIRLLVVLFGSSPFLSALVIRQPDLLDVMVADTDLAAEKPSRIMAEEIRGLLVSSPSLEDEITVLRRYRNGEILRIGLGDLLGLKDLQMVNAELTVLAEVLLNAVWGIARREAGAGEDGGEGNFAVVAMGKMGGREMNYSSDLDMVFLYEGPEDSREFHTRVAQRLITFLTSPTGEGVLYRIDMRLRPSGHSGPLVSTLEAFERYHREDAMVWERQALTKARWVGGNEQFRPAVEEVLRKLVFHRPFTQEHLDEVVRIRGRMEEEIAREGKEPYMDIKAGKGGLVDIEFAVQILQLVHGGEYPGLHTPSTLQALDIAVETGLVEEKQYNTLRRSYLFFREIENRSQIFQDRSDPRIPTDLQEAAAMAKRAGYPGDEEGAGRFVGEVTGTRKAVRDEFNKIVSALREQ
jgi:glutamate-ammonia-ligase adenylyltransferase